MITYAINRLKKEVGLLPEGHVGNIQGENFKLIFIMIPFSIIMGIVWSILNINTDQLNLFIHPAIGLCIGLIVRNRIRGESFKYRIFSAFYSFIPVWISCGVKLNYDEAIQGLLIKSRFFSFSYLFKFVLTPAQITFIIFGALLAASVATVDYH